MNLHDQLARDLDRHAPRALDVADLTSAARLGGRRIQRRRRLAGAAGGALAVLAVGGLAWGGVPGDPGGRDGGTEVASDRSPLDPSAVPDSVVDTGPATARGAVAALVAALGEVSAAETSGYYGQDPLPEYGDLDYFAMVQLDDGDGAADVGLNVQLDGAAAGGCAAAGPNCRSESQADGGRLSFYEVVGDKGPRDVRRVVELVSADGVRVLASATNGVDRPGGQAEITREAPPLTYGQLRHVVEQDYWGAELPQPFLEAGEELEPFEPAGGGGRPSG